MNAAERNLSYLASLPYPQRHKILETIAEHYGISVAEITAEVTLSGAEDLYEYIGNDADLQMQVFRDFGHMGG